MYDDQEKTRRQIEKIERSHRIEMILFGAMMVLFLSGIVLTILI